MTTAQDDKYYRAEQVSGVEYFACTVTVERAQKWVDHYTRQKWWAKLCGGNPPEFIEVRHTERIMYSGTQRVRGGFVITLSVNRLHEGILAHELAHIPTWNNALRGQEHGRAFAEAHLTIIHKTLGVEHARRHRQVLTERGIL